MTLFCRIAAFAAIAISGAALAHHNTGAYFDTEAEFVVEGTIEQVQWRNPHVYFTISGKSDTGEEASWKIEAGPTGIMRRLEWDKNTLQAGDAVTVTANPSRRDGVRSGYLVKVESPNKVYPSLRGDEVMVKLADAGSTEATANSIAGTWTTVANMEYFGSLFDEENLPLTEKGWASKQAFDETTNAPALDCIPTVAPGMMAIPDIKLVTVEDDAVRIRGEFYNSERVIYLDADKAPGEPTLHGRSIGRWEGNALLIETDMFAPHRTGTMFAVESSPQKKVTEKITLSEDGKSLMYSFSLSDPEMLTEPLAADIQWVYRPDLEYESLPCDLENSRQYLHD